MVERKKITTCRWSTIFWWYTLIFAIIFAVLMAVAGSEYDEENTNIIFWVGFAFGILFILTLFLAVVFTNRCRNKK